MRRRVGEGGASIKITPRLVDFVGSAMIALYAAALAGLCAALWLDVPEAAVAFVVTMIGSALTMCAIGLFERRLS